MSFREKKAWFTMIALIIVFVPYYVFMVRVYHGPDPSLPYMANMGLHVILAFIVLEVILVLLARRLSPEDVGIPQDEREQLFAFRAARTAYVALIGMVIAVTIPMIHVEGGNWGFGMLYLACLLFAEVFRAALLIVQYRRGY